MGTSVESRAKQKWKKYLKNIYKPFRVTHRCSSISISLRQAPRSSYANQNLNEEKKSRGKESINSSLSKPVSTNFGRFPAPSSVGTRPGTARKGDKEISKIRRGTRK